MTKIVLQACALLVLSSTVFSQCDDLNETIIYENITEEIQSITEGKTNFSIDLLKAMQANQSQKKESRGLFFSPHSIWSALMMTYMGTQGDTGQEMRNVLGIPTADKLATWEAFKEIISFDGQKRDSFKSANRIYLQRGKELKACVRKMLKNDIQFLDFEGDAVGSKEIINTWIAEETRGTIKDIIPPDGVDNFTSLVIANAVHFKENWLYRFNSGPKTFTTTSGEKIFVNMMVIRKFMNAAYSHQLQCDALQLFYSGKSFSMIILLPNNASAGIDTVINNLTPENLKNLRNDLKVFRHETIVFLPEFKMVDSYELSSILDKAGLGTLVDSKRVDLSGFTGVGEFTVDAIYHKSYINVNEEGTEASAATVLASRKKFKSSRPRIFNANHPFLFLIQDNISEDILFFGTVEKPDEFKLKECE